MPEHSVEAALAGRRILLDCRWLGMGGAGRITEHLLRELGATPPPGVWTLWGRRDRIEPLAFAGVTLRHTDHDPRALYGQRDLMAVPSCDVAVYLHQIRPFRPQRTVTFVLDTIPLRHGGSPPLRIVKRTYLRAVARRSARILTISAFSRASIERDLGVDAGRISIAGIPVDEERAARVIARRRDTGQEDVLLYLGRFDRHKNLERLCAAFAASAFARRGRLLLVGGWPGEVEKMREWLESRDIDGVEVRPTCSEEEVDALLATSRALIMPSIEEGYGLPAFEAAAAGLPVAASRTGAMADLPPQAAVLFDPVRLDEIREAIDEVTARPPTGGYRQPGRSLREEVLTATALVAVDRPTPSARTASRAD